MEQPPLEGPFADPKTTSSGASPPEIKTRSPSANSRRQIEQIAQLSSRVRSLIQSKMTRIDEAYSQQQHPPSFKNDDGTYAKILS